MFQLKSVYTVIKSPLVTEKSTSLNAQNKYTFRIDKRSNKIEVRRAIEIIYKVKVAAVNIINMKGKLKRMRVGQEGKTASWKKALVTLRKGDQIKIT